MRRDRSNVELLEHIGGAIEVIRVPGGGLTACDAINGRGLGVHVDFLNLSEEMLGMTGRGSSTLEGPPANPPSFSDSRVASVRMVKRFEIDGE